MTREYTALAVLAVAGIVALELAGLRTGLFRLRGYWVAMAVCSGFMIAVNGWLTKLSAPIVVYDERRKCPTDRARRRRSPAPRARRGPAR